MHFSTSDIDRIRSGEVYSSDGEKLGKASQVWLDDASGQPEWVSVSTGLFGSKESFVPLNAAQWTDKGLQVPFSKDQVKGAANIEPEADHLSEEAEQELYRHYGLAGGGTQFGQGEQLGEGTGFGQGYDERQERGQYTEGSEYAGAGTGTQYSERTRATDDAMTRSEERLNVGTESMSTGRARLRKYVVTEQEQVTVPVSREEVRIEREPITDANRDEAISGPEIAEAEHEVTLRAEQPVVTTEAVPVERVRLEKDTITEQETVGGEIRKERIELEEEGAAEGSVEDVDLSRGRQRQS